MCGMLPPTSQTPRRLSPRSMRRFKSLTPSLSKPSSSKFWLHPGLLPYNLVSASPARCKPCPSPDPLLFHPPLGPTLPEENDRRRGASCSKLPSCISNTEHVESSLVAGYSFVQVLIPNRWCQVTLVFHLCAPSFVRGETEGPPSHQHTVPLGSLHRRRAVRGPQQVRHVQEAEGAARHRAVLQQRRLDSRTLDLLPVRPGCRLLPPSSTPTPTTTIPWCLPHPERG